MLPRFIRAAIDGQPLRVYGDGSQTRTFCYVDDTVDTCVALHSTGACENGVINIGSDHEMSIMELAKTVVRVVSSSSDIKFLPPLAEGDMSRPCPDNSKMRQLLNRPLVSVEEGIRRLVDQYASHPVAGQDAGLSRTNWTLGTA